MYVSEIMRCFCHPDMTSSSVLSQMALHSHVLDGFWRSDHDFLIASRSNFHLGCTVSQIMRFYCKPDLTSLWFLRQVALLAILNDGFWKSDCDFLIAFHSNFLSWMHGFRDNEVLLQAGYEIIMISPPGAHYAIWHDWFWKSDHDLLMAFHSNFFIWDAWFLRKRGFIASRIWRHRDFSASGRSTLFYMMDSEWVTMTSW